MSTLGGPNSGIGPVAAVRAEPAMLRTGPSLPMHWNSIALILGKMATMVVGFLAWLVAARLFAPAAVGLASGAVSAMMLCVQLALFGTGAAVISLFPQHQRRPADLLNTSISIVALASLLAAAAFLLLATGLFRELSVIGANPIYAVAFLAMCVFGALGVLFDQVSTTLRRGDQALVRGALSGVVTLAVLAALPLGVGATSALAILAAWVVGNLAPVVMGFVQLRRTIIGYRYRPCLRKDLSMRLIAVGLPNWALTLTERAPGAIMPIVVIELLSPVANATWYAVWMMAWAVYVIPIQVGLTLFAEGTDRPHELARATRHGLGLSLTIGAAAAVAASILGPFTLSFLGPSYVAGGTAPLRILVVAVVPFAFIQAYFSVCRSRQRLTEAILTGIVSGVVSVGMASAAAERYGLRGMAIAWLATQLVIGTWATWRLWSMAQQVSIRAGRGATHRSSRIDTPGHGMTTGDAAMQ